MKILYTILKVLEQLLDLIKSNQVKKEQEENEKQKQQNEEDPVEFFEGHFGINDFDNNNGMLDDESDKDKTWKASFRIY